MSADERDRSDDWRGGYDAWKARAPDVGSGWGPRRTAPCGVCGVHVAEGERVGPCGHTVEERQAATNAARNAALGWGPST